MGSFETRYETALAECFSGTGTVATPGTYPDLWPNDKTFAALGVVHIDPKRAAQDMSDAFIGQWSDGMLPHQTYNPGNSAFRINDRALWGTKGHPNAPNHVRTTGAVCLPVVAEGMQAVSEHLEPDDRQAFLNDVFPKAVKYHEWLYANRDFGGHGRIATILPYETSINGLPYWSKYMLEHPASGTPKVVAKLPVESMVRLFRPDKTNDDKQVSLSVKAGILAVGAIRPLSKLGYDQQRIKEEWPYQIEDVLFNSVFVRNNRILVELAEEAGVTLSDELLDNMRRTERGLEGLYVPGKDGADGQYFSRTVDGESLQVSTIASLMPVYSGAISNKRIEGIIAQLNNPDTFGTPFPVPTTPANSPYYDASTEDLGGVKPVMNWLIGKGLLDARYKDAARDILRKTYLMIDPDSLGGVSKGYSSQTGKPLDQNRDASTIAVARDAISLSSAQVIAITVAIQQLLERAA